MWSSTIEPSDSVSGGPAICDVRPCERFDVTVDLPGGVWARETPGGLQFALRWLGYGNNVFMYVYRGGDVVAQAEGIISTSHSVLVPDATDGVYTVYVALDPDTFSDTFDYEGLVEVEYDVRSRPTRPLLPDLAARPQRNVTFDTPLPIFFEDPPPSPGESCNPSEVEEDGAQTCLRFDQVLANIGEGDLDMRFIIPHDPSSTAAGVIQRIHWSDDPENHVDEHFVDDWEYHDVHDHFHYKGFAQSLLYAVDAEGNRSGEPLRQGRKVSFCVADIEIDAWGDKGDGPRQYDAPQCLFPAYSDSVADYLVQGLTRGWSDVYDWFLPGQYVEVTGVPDGDYILDTVVDPDNTLVEADETNNCGGVRIRLSGMGSGSPTAELLGDAPPC